MINMYTVILVCVDNVSGETFTFSRPTTLSKKNEVYSFITTEAEIVNHDCVDTILLLKNGDLSPDVVRHWRAADGNFEDCYRK